MISGKYLGANMKIESLSIENFKAIQSAHLENLGKLVVVAGSNGCGKSTIFDAIKLLKSAYGQYEQNELGAWFSEQQIDINKLGSQTHKFFYDETKQLRVTAVFSLAESEKKYLRDHAEKLLTELQWNQILGARSGGHSKFQLGNALRRKENTKIAGNAKALAAKVVAELHNEKFRGELLVLPKGEPEVTSSPVLELMFAAFKPESLGIVEYHSPSRVYPKEVLSNINLMVADADQQYKNNVLRNDQNKYAGIKAQMAQSYIRQLLAREAGVDEDPRFDLKPTLDELFELFFPGKKFLGAVPTKDGAIGFPVELSNGKQHDINDLSSGEKEVLLGYLRLRNSTTRHSILLLDEPELHLNPSLAAGLPSFYKKHIGDAKNNQLWLVTHSDALLREAVREVGCDVFHMQHADAASSENNQLAPVSNKTEIDSVVIDLVGDLATFDPSSKIVLIEGEGSEIDRNMISDLFPDFVKHFNLVSLGSKTNVKKVHNLLEQAMDAASIKNRFFSLVDKDFDDASDLSATTQFQWDVYHIENYLLEVKYILRAINAAHLGTSKLEECDIEEAMENSAKSTIDELVRLKMNGFVNRKLVGSISLGYDPKLSASVGFNNAVLTTERKIASVVATDLSEPSLSKLEAETQKSLQLSLKDGTWKKVFRGRNVLKKVKMAFPDQIQCSYETFRNLIINQMNLDDFQPTGMKEVLTQIEQAK